MSENYRKSGVDRNVNSVKEINETECCSWCNNFMPLSSPGSATCPVQGGTVSEFEAVCDKFKKADHE